MSPTIINPFPIMISVAALLGVFVHDAQFISVIQTAISTPAIVADYARSTSNLSTDQHLHFDNGSSATSDYNLKTQQPSIRPRDEDDKKYVTRKRLSGNTFGSDYIWPFI
jgi:hypothetical protein